MKKNYKFFQILIIVINIIGIGCLIYFMIPYIIHDMSIRNPNAMLASYSWDSSGFVLTLGLIPLVIANILAYKFIDLKIKKLKLIFFTPSIICLIVAFHYLIIATDWKEEKSKDPVLTITCSINEKNYIYQIYQEEDEFSLGMDEDDKIPLSSIDYTSKDTIRESLENYYKANGGMCK
jgi:hypothetical protein